MDDYKAILDTYWPVIEAMEKVRTSYTGKIMPDTTGEAIKALNVAQKTMPLMRIEV